MSNLPMLIAPSVLASDFARLGEETRRADQAGADWIHIDVMDGHFVPNLTIGPVVVEGIRRSTGKLLDVHLMIEHPEAYVEPFARAGSGRVTFHVEAMVPVARRRAYRRAAGSPLPRGWWLPRAPGPDLALRARCEALIRRIRRLGCLPGLSLNPRTSVDWILPFLGDVDLVLVMSVWPGYGGQAFIESSLQKIARLRKAGPAGMHIEVDGGITPETAARTGGAGVDAIVAGTATYRAPDMALAIREIREAAERGRRARAE